MKRFLIFLLLAPSLFAQTPIPVINPSFEASPSVPNNNQDGPWGTAAPQGWTLTGTGGLWRPADPRNYSSLPDGTTVAWSNGGIFSQTLTTSPVAGKVYTLAINVGHRNFLNGNAYTITLSAGPWTCSLSANSNTIPSGTWQPVSFPCTTDATATGPFVISFGGAGQEVEFDNVSLTLAGPPPPFVWVMPGLGTATFPMQIPPACGASDGACSIALKFVGPNVSTTCSTAAPGTPANCFIGNQGTLYLIKTVSLPVPQVQETVIVVVSQP